MNSSEESGHYSGARSAADPPLRVVQVCPYDLSRPGGVQRHVKDLSAALARQGHEVTILSPGRASVEVPGVTCVGIGRFRRVGFAGTAFEVSAAPPSDVVQALDRLRPELVHLHTPWTPFLAWQVWHALARHPRVARVATFHDTPPEGLLGRSLRQIFRQASRGLARQLDAAVAVSPAPLAHLDLSPDPGVTVLAPCIDLSAERRLRRAPLATPHVLFVGRIEPRKGLQVLLRAWPQVLQRHPGARLWVCGDGPQRAQSIELARSLGIAERVDFFGALDDADRVARLAAADLFCAPALHGESYGLVLVEAMAAGVPVVAAANAGYASVLSQGGEGGLVPPGDVAALAACLSRLLGDLRERERLASWGREASIRSDVKWTLPRFDALYRSALVRRARRL